MIQSIKQHAFDSLGSNSYFQNPRLGSRVCSAKATQTIAGLAAQGSSQANALVSPAPR